jgi:structure-specific endonuclease subunit SLX1
MEQIKEIQDFFGVYLLCSSSQNARFRGKCYIGYTVNPNRRIKQHNAGIAKGGAKKTSNSGPWTMVMIIHGFPNNISALRVSLIFFLFFHIIIRAIFLKKMLS